MGQMSFFDAHNRLKSLSRMGDPLEPVKAMIPWEQFRPLLEQVHEKERKLVRTYSVTPANVHDSQVFDELIDPDNADPEVWADSAYRSEQTEAVLEEAGYVSHIHEKGQANQPLSEQQKRRNRERSRIRPRVEHIFGYQQNSMGGKLIRTIGQARAQVKIGLMILTYNLMRYLQLERRGGSVPAAA